MALVPRPLALMALFQTQLPMFAIYVTKLARNDLREGLKDVLRVTKLVVIMKITSENGAVRGF